MSPETLVVYDFDEDTTVPVVAPWRLSSRRVRGLRNDLGRGVLNAMKAGIAATTRPVRPDLHGRRSDEAEVVDSMVDLAHGGADVVSASRYMQAATRTAGRR